MILELEAENFQAHRKTHFVFDPGVNIIRGENCAGKTTIVRQLRSIVYFEPMYVRTQARKKKSLCLVRIRFGEYVEGTVDPVYAGEISRERKENLKKVLVTDSQRIRMQVGDGEARTYERIGKALPDEVIDFIDMDMVRFEDGTRFSLNFAEQIPSMGPFLIGAGYSGPVRMKLLGSVTEQHLFDEGARRAKNEGSSAARKAKSLLELKQEAEEKLRTAKEEPDRSDLLTKVLAAQGRYEKALESYTKKKDLLLRLMDTKRRLDAIKEERSQLPDLDSVRCSVSSYEYHGNRHAAATTFLQEIERRRGDLEEARHLQERLPDADRVVQSLRALELLRERSLAGLARRLRDAEEQRARSREASEALPEAADVRAHLAALEEAQVRYARRRDLLSRVSTASRRRDEVADARAVIEKELVEAQAAQREALKVTTTCPYAPFPVELQDACREKLDV